MITLLNNHIKKCITCGEEFNVRPSHYKLRKSCSSLCRKTGCITHNGYLLITVDGKQIQEHRHIYQEHIGRKLKRWEIIHHINGNKLDNRIVNLQLTTYPEHKKIHRDIGILTRFTTQYKFNELEIKNLYLSGLSTIKISKMKKCSQKTIERFIKKILSVDNLKKSKFYVKKLFKKSANP